MNETNLHLRAIARELHNISEELHVQNNILIEQREEPRQSSHAVLRINPDELVELLREIKEQEEEDEDDDCEKGFN